MRKKFSTRRALSRGKRLNFAIACATSSADMPQSAARKRRIASVVIDDNPAAFARTSTASARGLRSVRSTASFGRPEMIDSAAAVSSNLPWRA